MSTAVPEKKMVEMSDGAYLYTEYRHRAGWDNKTGIEAEEREERQTVIFIPGFCCTTAFFDQNAPVIADLYDVLVYDPRGQGRSSKGLQGHTVERNARDLKELIDAFAVRKAAVVAWSMAGQFIMDYVRQFGTQHLSCITLADCPLHAMGDEPWNAHGLHGFNMDHFNAHLQRSYNEWEEYCAGFAGKIWGGIDDTKIPWATEQFIQTPPWIAFAVYSDMVWKNGYPYLAKADVPMLFMGADSKVTENGKDLASKWYPQGRGISPDTGTGHPEDRCVTFDRGGHVFFMTEAEKFNRELTAFLENCGMKHCQIKAENDKK